MSDRKQLLTDALHLAVRAFAQYALETNEPSEEAVAALADGFIQDAQLRQVIQAARA